MSPNQEIDDFLHPRSTYHGKVKPENLVFNANLQEFAQKVSYICNLETAGKIETKDAYKKIKDLWKALKTSKRELGIGADLMNPDNAPELDVDGFNIDLDESANAPSIDIDDSNIKPDSLDDEPDIEIDDSDIEPDVSDIKPDHPE